MKSVRASGLLIAPVSAAFVAMPVTGIASTPTGGKSGAGDPATDKIAQILART
jgi:hypothetical protein